MTDALHDGTTVPSWCPIPSVADDIKFIHDAVLVMREQLKTAGERMERVEAHQIKQNGSISALKEEAFRAEGALGMLKWLVGIEVAVSGAVVAFTIWLQS